MTSRNDLTLQFYDQSARTYVEKTRDINMSRAQERFLRLLPAGAHILDAGCGSGRDARVFLDKQYQVSAFDGSAEMARLASNYLGMQVPALRFQDIDYTAQFDGVWACASLLHLEPHELDDVMARLFRALRPNGILYASFTHGGETRFDEGRLFADMSRERFALLCEECGGQYLDHWFEPIARRDRSWVNFLARASSATANAPG